MADGLSRFLLVGARFTRIIVDESRIAPDNESFAVNVQRIGPELTEHRSQDRKVIEVGMRLLIQAPDSSAPIVDAECRAGFVAASDDLDGDVDAFNECIDFYARATYWILRSRVQTLFATTRLQGAQLPWDTEAFPAAVAPTRRKAARRAPRAPT